MLGTISNLIVDWLFRQYQRLGKWSFVIVGGVLILLGFLIVRGCAPVSVAARLASVDLKRMADMNREPDVPVVHKGRPKGVAPVPAKATARAQPSTALMPAAPRAPLPPPKAAHPANFSDWKKEDFLSARAEGDPRLPDAVAAFGGQTRGNPAAAAFLSSLLADPEPLGRQPRTPGTQAKPFAEAITGALAANRTEWADAALRGIVSGKLPSPDDRAATAAALAALAARGDPDGESLLTAALTAPEGLRPPGGPLAPAELQKLAVAAVRANGSAALRLRLARYLVRSDTLPAVRECLVPCLEDLRIENLPAQIALYGGEEIDPKLRNALETHFAALSSRALGRTLGLPASQFVGPKAPGGGQPGASLAAAVPRAGWATPGWHTPAAAAPAAPSFPPVDPAAAVRCLWSEDFVRAVDRRMILAGSLQEAGATAVLASTLPLPIARARLFQLLDKHWHEGPKELNLAARQSGLVSDPGVMLVIKSLPHRALTGRQIAVIVGDTRHGAGVETRPKSVKAAVDSAVAKQREVLGQLWLNQAELILRGWCLRLFRTGLSAEHADPAESSSAARLELPIELHPRARPLAVYRLDWPGKLGEGLAEAARAPLRVGYARIEEKNLPQRVLNHYRRQLPACVEHMVAQGVWLDSFVPGDGPDTKRSIDVVVTKGVRNALTLADEEQSLVIEILWIEARDPCKSP